MRKAVVYIHGKGGNAAEAEHYASFCDGCDVIGFDYSAQYPWEAKGEFFKYFNEICSKYDTVDIIANSIGAYFAMCSLGDAPIKNAYFISPVVDMERLIRDMMMWAGVTEDVLREKGEVSTDFGETLSWEYLCFIREHPISWNINTFILYGGKDNLTSYETISKFAENVSAALTVMDNGEHWFHTEEQLRFLDEWLRGCIDFSDAL